MEKDFLYCINNYRKDMFLNEKRNAQVIYADE